MNRKRQKKEKNKLSLTSKLIICLCLSIILFSGILFFKIIFRRKIDNNEQVEISNILETIDIPKLEISSNKSERMLKISELQKENKEVIGWLEIEGTNINYPVCQSKDNKFYLNHTYKKTRNMSGSIFLDKDYDIKKPSKNLLMYGHRNKNGLMFEDIIKYENQDFYKEHQVIRFTTEKEDSKYKVISVFRSRVYYEDEKDVFKYYQFVDAEKPDKVNDFIKNIKSMSIYETKEDVHLKDYFITLSTCDYKEDDGRFVVVGKKINDKSKKLEK